MAPSAGQTENPQKPAEPGEVLGSARMENILDQDGSDSGSPEGALSHSAPETPTAPKHIAETHLDLRKPVLVSVTCVSRR